MISEIHNELDASMVILNMITKTQLVQWLRRHLDTPLLHQLDAIFELVTDAMLSRFSQAMADKV